MDCSLLWEGGACALSYRDRGGVNICSRFGRPARDKQAGARQLHAPTLLNKTQYTQSQTKDQTATMSEEAENEQLTIRIKDGVSCLCYPGNLFGAVGGSLSWFGEEAPKNGGHKLKYGGRRARLF